MNIKLLTLGSRGDVQPFVALGLRLIAEGHDMTVVTAEQFADFVTGYDIPFAPLTGEFLKLIEPSSGGEGTELSGGANLDMFRKMQPIMREVLAQAWDAVQGADAIVFHPKILIGVDIAERLGVPAFRTLFFPDTATSAYPYPAINGVPSFLNKTTYAITRMVRAPFAGSINKWRESVGLPKQGRFASDHTFSDGRPVPHFYAYSRHIAPPPADWPDYAHVTGYWFLARQGDYTPPPDLVRFIESGSPPVYVGFGSMPSKNPREKGEIILRALEQTGQRGIIATGGSGLQVDNVPPTVYALDGAPHDWLFPQMAAVMHHGGAGTTAAGLRAGVPSIIAPFFGDQPFWGARIHEAGAGPEPVPQKKLTVERVAAAIHAAVTDTTIKRRAADIGEATRTENGLDSAVNIIHRYIRQPQTA